MTENTSQSLLPLIVADVFELAGRFRSDGDAIAGTVGQTQARWQVMSAASADPKTVPQIAERLGVSRQAVQRIANEIVAERLARFDGNPAHKGSPFLVLTPRGGETLAGITKAARSYHMRIARRLESRDIAALHRGLRDLLTALNATHSAQ